MMAAYDVQDVGATCSMKGCGRLATYKLYQSWGLGNRLYACPDHVRFLGNTYFRGNCAVLDLNTKRVVGTFAEALRRPGSEADHA